MDPINQLVVTEVASGRVRARLRVDAQVTREVALSRDGRYVAIVLALGGVVVWQVDEGDLPERGLTSLSPIRTVNQQKATSRIDFTTDGRLAVTLGLNQSQDVNLYQVPTDGSRDFHPATMPPSPGRHSTINVMPTVGFHPADGRVWMADWSGFSVWDPRADRCVFESHAKGHMVNGGLLSRDGTRYALIRMVAKAGAAAGAELIPETAIDMWETSPPRQVWSAILPDRITLSFAFRSDGKQCVAVNHKGYVTTLDVGTGEVKMENQVADGSQDVSVALGPDARHVYWMKSDPDRVGTAVTVTSADDGQVLKRFLIPERSGRVGKVEFLDDRRMVVSSWTTDTLQIWDAVDGRWLKTLPGTAGVHNVQTTADGRRVIGLSAKSVTFWDADTGQNLIAMPGVPRTWIAYGLALRPDGKQLAAVGLRGQLRVWTLKEN